MGYRAAEEITLPARFLTITVHFIAILTILFDVKTLASQILLATHDGTIEVAVDDVNHLARKLSSLAYVALACFGVEYLGLFLGVSMFLRGHSCLYIILHSIGAITVALMYTNAWTVEALLAFVLCFNCLPAALELLTFWFVARVSFFTY